MRRKGSGAEQWLPASAEAFVWLRLYLAEIGDLTADGPVWLTLRRRRRGGGALERRPLNYEALRAVLRRANVLLGSNWTMHASDPPRVRCNTAWTRRTTSVGLNGLVT